MSNSPFNASASAASDDFLLHRISMHCRSRSLASALVLGCMFAGYAAAQTTSDNLVTGLTSTSVYLPVIGGGGGSQFKARCNWDQQLAGVELRAGDDIDAIRPVCVTTSISSSGVRTTGPQILTTDTGIVCTTDDLFCDTSAAVLALNRSRYAVAPGWYGGIGGHIERLLCPPTAPIVLGMDIRAEGVNTMTVNNIHLFCGQAATDQVAGPNPSNIFDAPGNDQARERTGSLRCPIGQVAVGVHGRAGIWLDALGLICDAPQVKTYVKLGRVELAPDATPLAICDAARSARARNSPAAPGLERQCAANGPPAKKLGRVELAPDATPLPICDAARSARARNSPAAPGLERQCTASGGSFAPLPPLDPAQIDALAGIGAAIAAQDADVQQARSAEQGASFQRGFDIASGIFGDPALGAQGNAEMGPGSARIRNSLDAEGQRGFTASASFHLARKFIPR